MTPNVSAEFPTTELLDELESRLTAPPSCLPQCASLDRVVFRTSEQDLLKVELDWSSLEAVAVPLPTSNYSASLSSVTVDNQPAPLQLIKGKSLLPLAPGSQKVNMEFDLVGLDQFVITFPFTPALIEEDHCCWQTSVLSDEKKSSIVFNRSRKVEATEEGTTSFEEIALHTDAVLERTLIFDFEPKVVTELRRRNELSDVSTFSVPLLEGETVLDAEANIQDGHNVITFTPGQRWVEWTSRFEPSKSIELIAPSHEQWVERWRIIGSNFWQLKASGIPSSPNRDEKIGTMFYPRQGEQLTIVIHPLSPADRETVTIQSTSLSLTPGSRESVGKLQFVVQAGEAGEIEVTLPESARVLKIEVDSEMVPSTPSNDVVLPIKRGRSTYVVEWSEESSLSLFYRTPSIELSSPASNIDINLTYPANRWILLLGGPTIGVAILFWGVVLVTVVLAWLLALLPKFPFTKLDAVLLAAGATLANIWALLFVAGWLVSIWWRSRNTLAGLSNVKYRLAQIGFIFLALIGVFALFMTVLSALQTPASMFMVQSPMADFRHLIGANWTMQLHWFSDFTQAELPTAWVFSLPFWVYQLTMLAWSLWLVSALFRWVRSSFSAISEPTLWRSEAEYLPEEDEKKEVSPTGSSDTWQETNPEPERT